MNDLETIRINNDAEIQFRQLSSGQSIAIIDDFLANPDELRAFAKRHADEFSMPPRSYPGILLDVDAAPMIDIYRFIRSTMAQHFSFLRGDARLSTMLSMTSCSPTNSPICSDSATTIQRPDRTAATSPSSYTFLTMSDLAAPGFTAGKNKQQS